jgi:TolB protein
MSRWLLSLFLGVTLALSPSLLWGEPETGGWSEPELVLEGASHPSLIQDAGGIYWMVVTAGGYDLYLSHSQDGSNWSTPIPLVLWPTHDSEPRLVQNTDGMYRLVFASDREGNFDLFLTNSTDGETWSEPRRLTAGPAFDSYPSTPFQDLWGTHWLAFISDREGNYSIYLMNSSNGEDWSDPVQVTDGFTDSFPRMIQDRDGYYWLAFTRLVAWPNHFEIFLMRSTDGLTWTEPWQVTSGPENNNYIDFLQDDRGTFWIAFTSERTGNEDIFVMGSRDGKTWTEPVQLSFNMIRRQGDHKADYKSLIQDRGGDLRIVFHNVRRPAGIYQVVGTGIEIEDYEEKVPMEETLETAFGPLTLRQQTTDAYPQGKPAWSPDGRRIAFTSEEKDRGDLYELDIETREISPLVSGIGVQDYAAYSPDGRTLVYTSNEEETWDLYLLDLATGERRRLTEDPHIELFPFVSPNGREVLYVSNLFGNNDLFVLDLATGEKRRLTNDSSHQNDPAWSPDGRRIAYESNEAGNWDLFVMDADGSHKVQLTAESENQGGPTWSPDGKWIAYESNLGGDFNLWVMRSDGTGKTQLTHHPADEYYPAWSPRGDAIAYHSFQGGNGDVWVAELPEGLRSPPLTLPPPEPVEERAEGDASEAKGLLEEKSPVEEGVSRWDRIQKPGVFRPRLSNPEWLALAALLLFLFTAFLRRELYGK